MIVDLGTYCHRWSPLQVRLMNSVALHTKTHQYAFHVVQRHGNCHQNFDRLWRRMTAPYVVIMDEDVEILQDGWLDALIRSLDENPKLGVVGAKDLKVRPTFAPSEPTLASPGEVTWITPPLLRVNWIPAFLMAFKRERVAPFLKADLAIPGQMGMTDLDLCLQIQDKGLEVAINQQVVVYHPSRDDDAIRVSEQRPLISQQEAWFPQQVAYMRQKWGDLWDRLIGRT